MGRRAASRVASLVAASVVVELVAAAPATAHTTRPDVDLGVPDAVLVYGAAGVAVASAVFGGTRPPAGRRAPVVALPVEPTAGSWAGAALAAMVFVVALVGSDASIANAAPSWFYVVFWIGGTLLCLIGGDLFGRVNPFLTFVAPVLPVDDRPTRAGHWPAAVGMSGSRGSCSSTRIAPSRAGWPR
jgi:hypothetical protein